MVRIEQKTGSNPACKFKTKDSKHMSEAFYKDIKTCELVTFTLVKTPPITMTIESDFITCISEPSLIGELCKDVDAM